MKPVIMIAGPTASGKSALAVRLARQLDGEVINADSMQVYSDLRVISARPTAPDMGGVPHHMFGHIDASVRYSVGAWTREAVPIILDCLARGKYPILTGGTGLYFKALTEGLADIPDIPFSVVEGLKIRLKQEGFNPLLGEAYSCDPTATARLLGQDPQRLLRILSVFEHTGQPLSTWQANTRPIIPKGYWRGIMLDPPRGELYRRIDKRFEDMVDTGGRSEIKALLARDLPRGLPAMKAIGVGQSFSVPESFSTGGVEWISLCQRDTRRFAKRQKTFFRKYAHDWTWISHAKAINAYQVQYIAKNYHEYS